MLLYGDSKYENKANKNILLASVIFVLSTRRFEDQLMWRSLHGKPYFLFPDVLKRWSFQKNCAGMWTFLYYRERWYYSFLKIWSYPQTENERWSFSKNTRKYDIFFERSEKMVFSRRAAPGHDLSCIIWKDGIFSQKHIFSLGRKWGMTLLKKYMEIWYFLCTRTGVTNVAPRPSAKKNQRWSYPAKIHLKLIDVLDWHPRKSSSNSLHFHGDLYRRFHILLCSEKKQET